MVTAADAIRIDGLKEFLASMKAAEVAVPSRVVRVALNEAAELVATRARVLAPSRSGALRGSIRALSTGSSARVAEGSARVPYAGFIDYGGTVGRRRSTVSHQRARAARKASTGAVRPFIRTGRILYPAFESQRADVLTQMNTSLREAIQAVGLQVEA